MGTIFCIVGKSASGKDTVYKKLLRNKSLRLRRIVPHTTRPIRSGEMEGVEYYFTTAEAMERLGGEGKIIESRAYDTVYGTWHYFMAKDRINLDRHDYLVIGTLESFVKIRDYFGENKVVPIYIDLEDGERLSRALRRERKQAQPGYEEMCRRFIADARDFSQENLERARITKKFDNRRLTDCLNEVTDYIMSYQRGKF